MIVDEEGWLDVAQRVPSDNFDRRPPGTAIDTVIVHHISLPPEYFRGDAIERLFTNRLDCAAHPYYAKLRDLRVSAHFLLRRHGELLQFVSCEQRAWHAGPSRLLDRERCNDFSIGIELEGSSERPFTRSQYRRLDALVASLARRYPLRFIAGHSDVAPGRKPDPGPLFDWSALRPALRRAGIRRPF
jgi:AmpD protein